MTSNARRLKYNFCKLFKNFATRWVFLWLIYPRRINPNLKNWWVCRFETLNFISMVWFLVIFIVILIRQTLFLKLFMDATLKADFFENCQKKYPIEILLTLSKFQDFRIFKTLHFLEFVLILPKEKLLYRLKGLSTYHIGPVGRQTGWLFAHPRNNVHGSLQEHFRKFFGWEIL